MSSANTFPESAEKAFLRNVHLGQLAKRQAEQKRQLAYFGLPAVEMLDVKLWRPFLGRIIAVERDPNMATYMYRTSMLLGVREKTTIIESELSEVTRMLAMGEREVEASVAQLPVSEQNALRIARSTPFDIVNLDFYGGFLYPTKERSSATPQILLDLLKHQSKHRAGCILALTLNLRDTGRDEYDKFIEDVFEGLLNLGVEAKEARTFYTSDQKRANQPPSLIRLRFCVPAYVQKIALDDFEVKLLGHWTYKTFYHAALLLEPRIGKSVLGRYPPIDELRNLLEVPVVHLEAQGGTSDWDQVTELELPGPSF